MSRGRALLRVFLALCMAALLLGDVFRGLHLLHARHVLCPEHGELVDADETSARAPGANARAEALPGGSGARHHEHCGLAAAPSRLSHLAIASAGPCIQAEALSAVLSSACSVAVQGRAILSYAPKQSPPLAAA
ncbi:MAG TPA: hypothetical protein VHU80_19450 [Polyangiaceae bacterium]|jgi:hypothetical protein|nr:hypothetical protein [Polyangiaceae bacterium]